MEKSVVPSWDEGCDVMSLSSEQNVWNSSPSYVDRASTGPWKQLTGSVALGVL